MEKKTDREIDRQPWQIEQRSRPCARQERSDGVEIAQRLKSVIAVSNLQWQTHDCFVNPAAECLVEAAANSHQNAGADHVKQALRRIKAGGEDHESDKRWHAAARQHTVVDLEHEKSAGEHQDVA